MIRLVTGGRYTGQFIIQTDNFVENETGRPRDWRGDTDTATFDVQYLDNRKMQSSIYIYSLQGPKSPITILMLFTLGEDDVKTCRRY